MCSQAPIRKKVQDMRQVKVYDNEEELSESEDELCYQTGLEASDDEEAFEDDDPGEWLDMLSKNAGLLGNRNVPN